MKKRLFVYSVALGCIFFAMAQSLDDFNEDRLGLNKKGMMVLGSWAAANIALSPILASRSSGSTKYFHQMNGYWNGVNLIIAGIGYYTATTTDPTGLTLTETLKEQGSIEKTLLFNAGLDLAYMVGGVFLQERSRRGGVNSDRLKGFGQSLVLQGGFLFAFDVVFYLVQKSHAKILFNYVDQLALSPTGFRMVWYL